MRLSTQEGSTIFNVLSQLDGHCEIYLYGSRADDALRGGDIDLLVFSDKLTFSDKITALVEIKDILGEQKIDLTIRPFSARHSDPFVMEIMKTAVPIAAPPEGGG
ncbi:nucleotidyltransferase family protein [Candidatus Thiosymbion oneisti]|uniref:nucleotidyltransferase family protein n=1 Tax=Candidatus Thiosymbion oneisti TaxID=589554 RepID=UPI000B7F2034|nr:nucleotidyltransferase domain-containing protein [Candidatus Thiosymbion oneisti]